MYNTTEFAPFWRAIIQLEVIVDELSPEVGFGPSVNQITDRVWTRVGINLTPSQYTELRQIVREELK